MYHIECVEKLMEQRAELQAENHELTLRLNDQRTTAAALRKVASEAEAALATRTANRDELVEMVRSLKASLEKLQAKYRNDYADWEAAASKAEEILTMGYEAALAKLTQRNDELRSTLKAYLATIKRLEAKVADREASKAEAEAALAKMTENWKTQKAATDAMQLDRARIIELEAVKERAEHGRTKERERYEALRHLVDDLKLHTDDKGKGWVRQEDAERLIGQAEAAHEECKRFLWDARQRAIDAEAQTQRILGLGFKDRPFYAMKVRAVRAENVISTMRAHVDDGSESCEVCRKVLAEYDKRSGP